MTEITDGDLAAELDAALAKLTPRAAKFALGLGGGQSADAAAQGAHLSGHPSSVSRLRRRVEPALRLLREQARRASALTLEVAVQRFRELSDEARRAQDYGSATRALREAALLLGLYPDMRVKLAVEQVDVREVTADEWERLAVLRHQVRALPAAAQVVEAEAVPAPDDAAATPEGAHGA